MSKSYETKLWVNNTVIKLIPFPEEFLQNVVLAVIASLKGTDTEIKMVDFSEIDGNIEITVNGNKVALTPFPNDFVANTINGLISTLKGVDKIKEVRILLQANK